MSGWRIIQLLGIVAVVAFLLVSFTPLTNMLNRGVGVPAQLQPAAAIIVLAGGMESNGVLSTSSLRRTIHGIVLFQRGFAPLLALSGPPYQDGDREEAEIRAEMARLFGVSPSAIVTETTALTTREEAARMATLLQPMGAYKILLVTSDAHMSRSQQLFAKMGFVVQPAPVEDLSNAWRPEARMRLIRNLAQELLARTYYRVAGYL